MRALVFGANGQVGTELMRAAAAYGVEARPVLRAEADLTDPDAIAGLIAGSDADIVLNAAAYTAVDKAEEERDLAFAVNGAAPGAMAQAAAAKGIPFLHVSTDYVFDGSGSRPWRETDPVAPLGAYGASKLAGERAVEAAGGAAVILRTAWVFSAHGGNFVRTMLRVGEGRDEMRVVADQFGGPTPARDIAAALWTIATAFGEGRGVPGLFHFAGAPATSWADFAEAVFARTGWPAVPAVTRIATADWPTPTARPANSVLDCSAIAATYGIAQPDWTRGLDDVISELSAPTNG
jgi:dTDP-4-dehydrorhamnose reductase